MDYHNTYSVLLETVPELAPLVVEHVEDNDEILPHCSWRSFTALPFRRT